MLYWYNQFIEPIQKDEIADEQNFVGLGLGDFMLQALQSLRGLVDDLNRVFGTGILFMDGRNLLI